MKNIDTLIAENNASLSVLYGESADARERIKKAVESFTALYGEQEYSVFSVSGRSEISGNHTDHNRGEVLAASVSLDIIAVAAPTDDGKIYVKSEGFSQNEVDLGDLDPQAGEEGTSAALIRGVCDGLMKRNRSIGGFCAYMTSSVLGGSGLSSSAAFEDMVGNIENHLYNDGEIDYIEISQISQYAENVHFGKPCGLMDQIACACGGFVHIDFADPAHPVCEKIELDLASHGYDLCVVNTGGSHADLTDDYAAVPAEMKKVAAFFGKEVLRELTKEDVLANVSALREYAGDRAILRAIHFFDENERVKEASACLAKDDILGFFGVIKASGVSSAMSLQNYFTPKAPAEQGITLACAVANSVLAPEGVCRVHGGGFAGTIQAFVPKAKLEKFVEVMENAFGKGAVTVLSVRPVGMTKIF
ncbi:MAG: galactokinase [Clostridia bacterium]|nr:galactokinase [Clostridia bacterium]